MNQNDSRFQEPTRITVVMCSRDRSEQLRRALPHLRAALDSRDDAIVVDSGSSDGRTAGVAREFGFRCIRVDEPGLSRARNAGIGQTETEIVAFTDDDCFASPEWLDRLRADFAEPRLGFVTGRVASSTPGSRGTAASVLERGTPVRYQGAQDPFGIGHGANMAYRRDALLEVGLFDEQLGAGARLRSGEDVDMLYRVLKAGWLGAYDPRAIVTHDQWREGRDLLRLRLGYGIGNGAFRAKAARRDWRAVTLLLRAVWHQGIFSITYSMVRTRTLAAVLGAMSWNVGLLIGVVLGLASKLDGPNFADR